MTSPTFHDIPYRVHATMPLMEEARLQYYTLAHLFTDGPLPTGFLPFLPALGEPLLTESGTAYVSAHRLTVRRGMVQMSLWTKTHVTSSTIGVMRFTPYHTQGKVLMDDAEVPAILQPPGQSQCLLTLMELANALCFRRPANVATQCLEIAKHVSVLTRHPEKGLGLTFGLDGFAVGKGLTDDDETTLYASPAPSGHNAPPR